MVNGALEHTFLRKASLSCSSLPVHYRVLDHLDLPGFCARTYYRPGSKTPGCLHKAEPVCYEERFVPMVAGDLNTPAIIVGRDSLFASLIYLFYLMLDPHESAGC